MFNRLSLFLFVKPLNDLRVTQQSRLTVIHQLRFLFCTKRQFMDYFMHTMDWQLPRACRTCPSTDVARVDQKNIWESIKYLLLSDTFPVKYWSLLKCAETTKHPVKGQTYQQANCQMIRIRSLSDFLKCKCFLKHHHCTKQAEQIQTAVLDFIIFTCDLHAGWEISVHFTLFHVI